MPAHQHHGIYGNLVRPLKGTISPPAEDGPEASEEATAALKLMKFAETQVVKIVYSLCS